MEKKIVILGAGPTGLGAGYRLKELGYENFHIYDRNSYIGGLSASFTDEQGFTWDIGGHVMFSHYEYYDKVFETLMGDDYQENMRECWIRMFDRWVPYPFQNNVRHLPKEACFECISGLIEAQTQRDYKQAKNFGEFIDAVFGDGIAKHFMRPYNFKVWAHEPEMMNKDWIGERVAVLDINRALKNIVLEKDDYGWGPNNKFKFPLFGGTGEFYRRFAEPLEGHYTLNAEVEYIDSREKQVFFTDGRIVSYDILLSTMPLDILCNQVLNGSVPKEVKDATSRLKHSGGYMVGIGIKQPCPSTKCWMYFPEDNCPFYRVTYLSNYSPNMTPDKDTHYSLLCEISESEFKPVDREQVIESTIQGLVNSGLITEEDRKDIISTWVYYADYSYPTPTVERDEILAQAIPWLEEQDIYSRGRFGMWKYEVANTDHTLMQGVELVNRLVLGEPETTIGIKYESTLDGRQAAVHERSVKAGSGDPKKEAERKALLNGKKYAYADRPTNDPGDKDEVHISEEELGVTVKE
jgi:protoporphyrinogen oxidase